jgi:hypothetical protein
LLRVALGSTIRTVLATRRLLHATFESGLFQEPWSVIDALVGFLQVLDLASFWVRSWGNETSGRSATTLLGLDKFRNLLKNCPILISKRKF